MSNAVFDPSARLFVRFRGKTTGPFSLAQIEQMRQLGRVTAFHEVSADRIQWILAGDAGLVASPGMGQNPGPILGAMPEVMQVEDEGPDLSKVSYTHADFNQATAAAGSTDTEDLALALSAPPDSEKDNPQPFRRFGEKLGRNDPCPCGSGKKYKQCHGRLA